MSARYVYYEAPKVNFKQMCEKIEEAKILKKKDGTYPTAEEIFRYSPSGELGMIFGWYGQAKVVLGEWTYKEAMGKMFNLPEGIDGVVND